MKASARFRTAVNEYWKGGTPNSLWEKGVRPTDPQSRPKGASFGSIYSYYRGDTEPGPEFLRWIAPIIGVPTEWLVSGEGAADEVTAAVREPSSAVIRLRRERSRFRASLDSWMVEELPALETRPEYVRAALLEVVVGYRRALAPDPKKSAGAPLVGRREQHEHQWLKAEEAARAVARGLACSLAALGVDVGQVPGDQLDRFILAFAGGVGALFPRFVVKPAPLVDKPEEGR